MTDDAPEEEYEPECVICGKGDLGRRFAGNDLCPNHWEELLEEGPDNPIAWITDRKQ